MLMPFLGGVYRKVLSIQLAGTAMFAGFGLLAGGSAAALSVLCGGAVVMAGNLAYAWLVRPSRVQSKSGNEVLLRHVLAQVAKILIVLGLMSGAFVSGWFAAGWLVAAVGVALLGHWVSLLFVR